MTVWQFVLYYFTVAGMTLVVGMFMNLVQVYRGKHDPDRDVGQFIMLALGSILWPLTLFIIFDALFSMARNVVFEIGLKRRLRREDKAREDKAREDKAAEAANRSKTAN